MKLSGKVGRIARPVYTLNLEADREQIGEELSKWRIVSTASNPTVAVSQAVIGFGNNDGTTFNFPPLAPLSNCRVECEMRIIDDGGDASRWAGIRVRAFLYDIRFGYLVYMRRTGTVELYRAGEVLGGANKPIVSDTKDEWTHIRIDIFNTHIWVFVNGKQHLHVTDTKFRDKDSVCLHTFGTHAQFRNLRVLKLLRKPRK